MNIKASMTPLGTGILGQNSSVMLAGNYNLIRNAMVADAAPYPNNSIVSYLPTASDFSAWVPQGFGLDGNILASKANLKALGFSWLDTAFGLTDATITFSTNYLWDFDHGDGVAPGTYDFETVVAHELGHSLGFYSKVDYIDWLMSSGLKANVSVSPLDLFRFAESGTPFGNPSTETEFTTTPRMLAPGVEAVFDDIDNEYSMSTGSYFGDGSQASHWKADENLGFLIGVMDPTLANGISYDVSASDVRALDLIGYNMVPEPATMLLVGTGLIGFIGFRIKIRKG